MLSKGSQILGRFRAKRDSLRAFAIPSSFHPDWTGDDRCFSGLVQGGLVWQAVLNRRPCCGEHGIGV